jgi:cytochrome c
MNMKSNMALSALVCAGIIAWLSGFVSQSVVAPETLKENAVKIEVADSGAAAGAGAAKAAGPEPILAMIAAADVARGQVVAKACAACHSFEAGGKNGVGPNLHGIVGRKKQSVAGFSYSGSLNGQGGDAWTYEELNKFLWKPKAYAAGTKMTFVGIKKTEDRAAVVAYLRSLGNAAAPSAAEIAKEQADLGAAPAATPAK